MISLSNIFIKYGDRTLLDRISFSFSREDKIGLVGRNGAGKSTILKILAGDLTPDDGKIAFPSECSVGYLHQEIPDFGDFTIREEAMKAFDDLNEIKRKIDFLSKELETRTDYESDAYLDIIDKMTHYQDQFHHRGGHEMDKNIELVLAGLGFTQEDLNKPVNTFSGGWQMRVELAKMLLRRPDYLLLDEPTNHLDIESILWLEEYLRDFPSGIILISHDRSFLDGVTNRTLEIENGKLYDYKTTYSKYVVMRDERRTMQESAFKNQQRIIAEKERVINKFMAKATKTKQAQSMKKQLDKMERIEIDSTDNKAFRIRFRPAPRSGARTVEVKNVAKSFGNKKVLTNANLVVERKERIAFVGQNGQGKSTLVKLITNQLDKDGGDILLGHNVLTGYFAQNQSELLDMSVTVLESAEDGCPEEMRSSVRSILGAFLFSGEDIDKKVSVLSGGEKARLSLAKLLLRPINFLVLDEPTNHLDMQSKEVLKKALMQFDGSLLVVSHDRNFLDGLTNRTVEFRDHHLHTYLGGITEFLSKRKVRLMRDLERKTKKVVKIVKPENTSHEDRQAIKKLERTVQYAERKIEKLEEEIGSLEVKINQPGFYQSEEEQAILKAYEEAKSNLGRQMEEWENAIALLEKKST